MPSLSYFLTIVFVVHTIVDAISTVHEIPNDMTILRFTPTITRKEKRHKQYLTLQITSGRQKHENI